MAFINSKENVPRTGETITRIEKDDSAVYIHFRSGKSIVAHVQWVEPKDIFYQAPNMRVGKAVAYKGGSYDPTVVRLSFEDGSTGDFSINALTLLESEETEDDPIVDMQKTLEELEPVLDVTTFSDPLTAEGTADDFIASLSDLVDDGILDEEVSLKLISKFEKDGLVNLD